MNAPAAAKVRVSREHARELMRQMVLIRRFEAKCAELYGQEKIRGFLHLYDGEEANAVGVMQALTPDDAIVATYREHGHALARGLPLTAVMAEMYGKATGCSHGHGGSMHLFDAAHRFYGGNAIVGGGLPLAVGLALADKLQGRARVTCCIFGDGAVAEGEFHESMNLAALWKLPVLFVCENNLYAMGTALERSESVTDLCRHATSYGIAAEAVDGMNVVDVEAATRRAAAAVRAGGGPRFLENRTYRFRAHSMFDAELYRDKAEVEAWKQRGPIVRFREWTLASGTLHADDLDAIEAEVAAAIDAAVAFAEQSPWEPVESLLRDVYAPSVAAVAAEAASPDAAMGRRRLSYRDAVREALRESLRRDARVFLMGEDVGRYGGSYACSKGLLAEFGEERIRDTPLCESGFVGAGIGAALGGMHPIVEVMTINFSLLALDQIVNNAATLRHMSGGQVALPLVIRMATGAGRQLAAQHSHSLEAWYAHVPGIRAVAPATVADARGMLRAALAEPNPVVMFEHATLYNDEDELPLAAPEVDIDHAAIRRPGRDVSLITYGGSLKKALAAAEVLAGQGIDAEVIDLRTLRPLDLPTLLGSVRRTHRAVIVDEGWRTGSLAGEIAAQLAEQAFYDLDAPVARVCSAEVPIPYPRHLERAATPQVEDIVAAAHRVLRR
jgi:pyruvate dehydrogenase E1 component beta subunit/2-oxoisovalerate dehydrogenase E1 component